MATANQGLIYLDNAATSWPKPEPVYEFMTQFYRECGVNPGRSGFDKAIEAGSILDQLRKRLAQFFGNDPGAHDRVCFGYNATDALNLIISGLLEPGDHVVTTCLEHNSVLRPVNHLVRDASVTATVVPCDAAGWVEPEAVRAAITGQTKLVVVNHASNVLGTVQPLTEIGAVCREHGVLLAVDASQSAGVVPINMVDMNVDVLAFTGHKSLMGAMGIGGLVARRHVEIRQTRSGGTGVRSAYPYHLEEYPYRLEFGTPNMVGVASLWAGQQWLEAAGGLERVHADEMVLARRLVDGLRSIEGVTLYCCDTLDRHVATLSMNVNGLDAADVGTMLDVDFDVAVRTGLHCAPLCHERIGTAAINGSVRFGIGPFNTIEHIDTAIRGVQEITARARKRSRSTGLAHRPQRGSPSISPA